MVLSVFTEGVFVVQAYLSVREVIARRLQHCRPERQPRRLPGPSKLDLFSENNKLAIGGVSYILFRQGYPGRWRSGGSLFLRRRMYLGPLLESRFME